MNQQPEEGKASVKCTCNEFTEIYDCKKNCDAEPPIKRSKASVDVFFKCPACGGDGKETCNNPDHGFISAIGGEVGRLGCPGCGHDPNHKINRGRNVCPECGGYGHVTPEVFEEYGRETGYDEEPVIVAPTQTKKQ